MKKIAFVLILLFANFNLFNLEAEQIENSIDIIDYYEHRICSEEESKYINTQREELHRFLELLEFKESSCNWTAINSYGYIGKYQFGGAVLKELNVFDNINYWEFKKNPSVFAPTKQDSLVIELVKLNYLYLKNYTDNVSSGLIASAHLVGRYGVKKYLDNGHISRDGNGTKVTDYLEYFDNFDIDFELLITGELNL